MKAKETASKTTAQILRDNVCTLFNLLNLLIAIALIAVHAWSNLFFIFVIALNTVIGIAQELKAKRLIEKLTLLSQPNAKIERNGTIQSVPIARGTGTRYFAAGERQPDLCGCNCPQRRN